MKLKQNKEIEPITINGIKKLLSQYTDDLWTVTKLTKKSFEAQLKTFEDFRKFSGLAINYNKTEVVRLGAAAKTNAKIYSRYPLIWSDGPVKILGIQFFQSTKVTLEHNYRQKIQKMKDIFSIWQTRSLSIIGKVLITNIMGISQLTYCMHSLPEIPANYIREIEGLMCEFIWKSKKSKIALQRLFRSYKQAGLKLVNVKIKDHSLKFSTFVRLFINSDGCNSIIPVISAKKLEIPVQKIKTANLNVKDIKDKFKTNNFQNVKDILIAWAQHNYIDPRNKQEVLAQKLWYNSNIKIAGKICKPPTKEENEPQTISDIRNVDRWLDFKEIKTKFPKTRLTFLHIKSLHAAVPNIWLKLLKIEGQKIHDLTQKVKTMKSSCSKYIYWKVMDAQRSCDDKYRSKWEEMLNVEIDGKTWKQNFSNIVKLTLSTKLCSFQYKLSNFALVTNKELFTWGIKPNNRCTFCNSQEENYLHLFVKCEIVRKSIWKPLIRWLDYYCYIEFTSDPLDILFCTFKGLFAKLVNTVILIAKYYIYVKKCLEQKLILIELITEITNFKKLEKYIATKNLKLLKNHEKKWQMYDRI